MLTLIVLALMVSSSDDATLHLDCSKDRVGNVFTVEGPDLDGCNHSTCSYTCTYNYKAEAYVWLVQSCTSTLIQCPQTYMYRILPKCSFGNLDMKYFIKRPIGTKCTVVCIYDSELAKYRWIQMDCK